jgi:hypothetical protein
MLVCHDLFWYADQHLSYLRAEPARATSAMPLTA